MCKQKTISAVLACCKPPPQAKLYVIIKARPGQSHQPKHISVLIQSTNLKKHIYPRCNKIVSHSRQHVSKAVILQCHRGPTKKNCLFLSSAVCDNRLCMLIDILFKFSSNSDLEYTVHAGPHAGEQSELGQNSIFVA